MKATFELRTWLGENREQVIEKYNKLTTEKFFNGITLKDFMVAILSGMERNRVSDKKHAARMLPMIMGDVYVNNSKVEGFDKSTSRLESRYNGTAAMAMI
jgi:hypothetical protein